MIADYAGAIPLKQCSSKDTCVNPLGCWLPAAAAYFFRDRTKRDGLRSACKVCEREYKRRYYEANPEKKRESDRRYNEANAEKKRESDRRWREANAEKISEQKRRYYEANAEKVRERSRRWNEANPEKLRERVRRWEKANPDKGRVKLQRRRARKRGLPDTFTVADWQHALAYFDNRCAVCGHTEDFWTVLSKDHWIAVTDPRPDNPGTVPTNILPLCHARKGVPSGQSCCNNSKKDKDPTEWVTRQFGKRRAKQILRRIEDYFQSL